MDLGPFRQAVRRRMEEQGLNQSDLARRLEGRPAFPNFGTAQKWLSKYLLGGSDPPALPLLSVCQVLGIPLDEIGLPSPPKIAEPPGPFFRRRPENQGLTPTIPVISFASAGDGAAFTDQGYPAGAGMYDVPRPADLRDPRAFGVEVAGDSMAPKYEPGQVVIVDTTKHPINGDYAVVGLVDGGKFIKRWRQHDRTVTLESINQAYASIKINREKIRFAYKIVGTREK